MPLEFPVPVLSVAKDAVRELEGREALSSLWALFTKCKESIKDGRRLENLSWRLWYRDMVTSEKESLKELWQHNAGFNEKLVLEDSTPLSSRVLTIEPSVDGSQGLIATSTSAPSHASVTLQTTPLEDSRTELSSRPRENGDIRSIPSNVASILHSNTNSSAVIVDTQDTKTLPSESASPSNLPLTSSSFSSSSALSPQSTSSAALSAPAPAIQQSTQAVNDQGSLTSPSPCYLAIPPSNSLVSSPAISQSHISSQPSPSLSVAAVHTFPTLAPSSAKNSLTSQSPSILSNMALRPDSGLSHSSDSALSSLNAVPAGTRTRRSSFQGRMIFELLPPPSFGASPTTRTTITPGASGATVKEASAQLHMTSVPAVTCAGEMEGVELTGENGNVMRGEEPKMRFRWEGHLLTPTASMSGDDNAAATKEPGPDSVLVALRMDTTATMVSQLPTPGSEYDDPHISALLPVSISTSTSTAPPKLDVHGVALDAQALPASTSTASVTMNGRGSAASTPTSASVKTPTTASTISSATNSLQASTAGQHMMLTLPRLVIVHPTPGPTPHPTPPATPRFLMGVAPVSVLDSVSTTETSLVANVAVASIPPVELPPAITTVADIPEAPLSPEVMVTPTNTAISLSSPLHPPSEYTLVDDEVIPPFPITRKQSQSTKDHTRIRVVTVAPEGEGEKHLTEQVAEQSMQLPLSNKVASPPTSSPQQKAARRAHSVGSSQSTDSAQTTESSGGMNVEQPPTSHVMSRSTSGRGATRPASRAAIASKTHSTKSKVRVSVGAGKNRPLSRSRSRGSNVGGELGMTTVGLMSAGLAMTSTAPPEKAASPPNGQSRPPAKRSYSSSATVTSGAAAHHSPPTPKAPALAPALSSPLPAAEPTPEPAVTNKQPNVLAVKAPSGKPSASTTGTWGRKNARPTFNIGSDEGSKSGSSVSGGVVERDRDRELRMAGKGKARLEPPPTATQSNFQLLQAKASHQDAQPSMPAQAQQSHPAAQPQPRRIVLTSDDSDEDWGTETDVDTESAVESGNARNAGNGGGAKRGEDDDDDNWSSEDLSTDDVQISARRESPATVQQARPKPSPQHQRLSGGHTGARPKLNGSRTQLQHPQAQQMTRAQASRQAQALRAQHTVEQAALKALEAQRLQDEMFTKKPVPSSEQLAAMRSKSVGLLTQLMHPDPRILPPTHPYRRNFSSGHVRGGLGQALGMSSIVSEAAPPRPNHQRAETETAVTNGTGRDPRAKANARRASADDYRIGTPGKGGMMPSFAPGIKPSKSGAALPVASQVAVGSVATVTASAASNGKPAPTPSPKRGSLNPGSSGGYRPRGKPVDQELEDSSSDEEDDGRRGDLQMSQSVAHLRLQEFAQRRGIKTDKRSSERPEEDTVSPELAAEPNLPNQPPTLPTTRDQPTSSRRHPNHVPAHQLPGQLHLSHQAPAPIPMNHPYNLPPAPAPTTPRTTRRQMLQTEMSESLRRNLLWERQVHRQQTVGPRRSQSTVLGNPIRPMATIPAVVEVRLKKPVRGLQPGDIVNAEIKDRRGSDSAAANAEGTQDREHTRERALARNRSWANDYHTSGW